MITYFKMKHTELKLKYMFYKAILNIVDSKKEILDLFHKIFVALKDVPEEELKEAFVKQLAEIIHNENKVSGS